MFDGFTLLGESLLGRELTADRLVSTMEDNGIDRAVVCPARPRAYHLGPANDLVAAAVRRYPSKLVGFARVDPLQRQEAVAEAERAFTQLDLAGLFIHPWEETFPVNSPLVNEIVAVAAKHGRSVIVAAGYPWLSEGLQLGELAGRFPAVTFLATNGGQINISGLGTTDVLMALEAHPNIVLQTAGVYREDFLERVVDLFGASRLVFATGAPVFDPRLEVRRVAWAHFKEAEREQVFGQTLSSIIDPLQQ